ncbi:MAG: hypothetical protein KF732_11995 [Flavobacteriales bacterium]|nr:hypothetical protein [Flavobacteriales bacterium]
MKKLKHTLFILLIFFTLIANAQITVYNSYDDYKNKKGESFEGYQDFYATNNNFKLIFKSNGTKTVISCKDIWGFTYKKEYQEGLFRVDRQDNQPCRVLNLGKIVYYENGGAHMSMLKNYSSEATIAFGHFCYLSKNLESDFVPMPAFIVSKSKQKLNAFKDENPQYKALFDCIEKDYDYKKVRICVEAFEK